MTGRFYPPLRRLMAPALGTLIVGSILIGLGLWQLHRLAWKEALLARIETRSKAAPADLPPLSRWTSLTPDEYEYRHVAAAGIFDNAAETLILRASEDGPGYHVIAPLRLDGGGVILVDRGFVPAALKDPATRADGQIGGEIHVTGLLRAPEPRNAFTPADDPAHNEFFTRDPLKIAARDRLANAAPFSIDADPTMVNPGGWPKPAAVAVAIPNNHLSYALTWFGLALGLFGVFAYYAWSRTTAEEVRRDRQRSTALTV